VVSLCSTLTTIDFSFNNIRQFPRGLSESTLHSLSLNHNEIDSVPEEVGYLRELQYLQLAYNGLMHLSDSLGSCTKLRYLKLNNNELTSLPGTLGSLHSLDSIHCNDNRIAHLPVSITQLSSLETIDIRRNEYCTPDPAIISWLSSVPNVPPWQSTQKQCD
jgi:Leucine-rich repeat (LRR) protein